MSFPTHRPRRLRRTEAILTSFARLARRPQDWFTRCSCARGRACAPM